jgi:hypothetical protein
MKKTYDNILVDEYGQPIQLTADDFIEYLLHSLQELRTERDRLEKQLANIRLILNDQQLAKDSSNDF